MIYVLCDPDGTPRYVGASYHPQFRYYQHCEQAVKRRDEPRATGETNAKEAWLIELIDSGQKPVLKLIDSATETTARDVEADWIVRFRAEGKPLTNSTRGSAWLSAAEERLRNGEGSISSAGAGSEQLREAATKNERIRSRTDRMGKTLQMENIELRLGRSLTEILCEKTEQGLSWEAIGADLGVTRITLRDWRRRLGIERVVRFVLASDQDTGA